MSERIYETRSGPKLKSWSTYCTNTWNKTADYLGTQKISYLSNALRNAAMQYSAEFTSNIKHR